MLQDYPLNLLQVIVSDDFSDDGTREQVLKFANQHPEISVVLVIPSVDDPGQSGKKMTVTRAISRSTGDIILATDGDTWRSSGWVRSMTREFADQSVMMTLGPVTYPAGSSLLQEMQRYEFAGIMGSTAGAAAVGQPVMCNGANLAYRRTTFEAVGGFRDNLQFSSGDDQFLMDSVKRMYGGKSIRFVFDREAMVKTDAEQTIPGFIHQRIRWMSKSRGYRDPIVIITGLATLLLVFLIFVGMTVGFFFPRIFGISCLMLLIKLMADLLMVKPVFDLSGSRINPVYYILAHIFQVLYVPVLSVAALFMPFRWKGRRG